MVFFENYLGEEQYLTKYSLFALVVEYVRLPVVPVWWIYSSYALDNTSTIIAIAIAIATIVVTSSATKDIISKDI